MSHPMEGRAARAMPVFQYEVRVEAHDTDFSAVLFFGNRALYYWQGDTFEQAMRWASRRAAEESIKHGSPHFEVTFKLVSK